MWAYPEIATLGDIPAFHSRRTPDKIALMCGGRETSFRELEDLSTRLAHAFLGAGMAKGQTIAFLGYNSDEYFLALFAAAKLGCPFLPLNWRLSPHEVATVIDHARPGLLIAEAHFAALLPRDDAGNFPCETRVVDSPTALRAWAISTSPGGDFPKASQADVAMLLYTSGTTGNAKAVEISHLAFSNMRLCEHLEPAFHWQSDDSMLLALPNFHLFGNQLAFQFLYNGLAVSVMPLFDAQDVLATIDRDKPTTLALVPAMVRLVLDHPQAAQADFSGVRMLIYSGSPITEDLLRRGMEVIGCKFMQYYGATELNGAALILRPDEHLAGDPQRLRSCGRPLPLVDVRLLDDTGAEVEPGVIGEFVIRTPAVTNGYHGNSDATGSSFKHGWYHTGDAGYRDEDGFYYICDRLKDMIVSGGENIFSAEIERVLGQHPAVAQVAVIGVPDPRWGEAVKACIVLHGGAAAIEADLSDYARSRLAGYKVPKSFDFLDVLPLSATGKVLKHVLRAPFWAAQTRAVG